MQTRCLTSPLRMCQEDTEGGKGSRRAQRAGEASGAGLASLYGSQLPRNKEKIKMGAPWKHCTDPFVNAKRARAGGAVKHGGGRERTRLSCK